jgi:hypothetical protein
LAGTEVLHWHGDTFVLPPGSIHLASTAKCRNRLLLGGEIRAYCPVHILQGMQDEDVPWRRALVSIEHLASIP